MSELVRLEGVSRTYGSGEAEVRALLNTSLSIENGDFVAVMGASGSGKSTLMHILGLLTKPDSGRYFLEGDEVSRLDLNGRSDIRRRKLGFVFQSYNLLGRNSAIENVELPLLYDGVASQERLRRAEEALEAVGMVHRRFHRPSQLSGGEQQRVAIARSIVNSPSLILADEPTGSLDSSTGQAVLSLFSDLNRDGRTVVLVTHDAEVARRAGRIVTLQDGQVMSDRRLVGKTDPDEASAANHSPRSAAQ